MAELACGVVSMKLIFIERYIYVSNDDIMCKANESFPDHRIPGHENWPGSWLESQLILVYKEKD
jgi:hypothetical protein